MLEVYKAPNYTEAVFRIHTHCYLYKTREHQLETSIPSAFYSLFREDSPPMLKGVPITRSVGHRHRTVVGHSLASSFASVEKKESEWRRRQKPLVPPHSAVPTPPFPPSPWDLLSPKALGHAVWALERQQETDRGKEGESELVWMRDINRT